MFKLVCGAGNEDAESVKRLVYVYTLSGCKLFDISARKEILEAAKQGQKLAGTDDAHFCVSVGIKGDKHIMKASIDKTKCIECLVCCKNCPQSAIDETIIVNKKKCIGCGICMHYCPQKAIETEEHDVDCAEILPYMVNNGVEFLELHIMGHDKKDLEYKWNIINQCNPKYASICIDRENFGNKEVLERIRNMISMRKPYTTIIQADGIPMSGGKDDYKTTLQAVAMAEIIQNANLPVYIMLSGGTNSKTAELANMCGINYWGIAIGSWARKIVREYINTEDFWQNAELRSKAVKIAQNLVHSCK